MSYLGVREVSDTARAAVVERAVRVGFIIRGTGGWHVVWLLFLPTGG